ncbi:type IX secretion system membrane protein PorP/SprF [Cognataquiflexum rubidum]|uniref:PorP/SprF family type IX secretion system membrane protein n=1 Tax=Cognataquiflexum rubidum TaxID=2922273 RepID=UPI001F12DA3C|nr:type IX secretion system membrane protein PorP/SprF [Cognataquiflexum rubidum]MCH6233969.1 type IX secretion system membrane protein PorP/SprF [Cognataquiflexum rubidum]
MKRNYKIYGLFLLMAMMAYHTGNGQQLPQFSQYIFNGLHINPGYAGYKNQGYIQSTYRNQWVNLEGAPRTFTITADLSANEGMMGFGVSVLSDQIGPTRTTTGLLTYSYRIQTGKESFLALGASAGVSEYQLDGDMLNPIDQDDVEIPSGINNLYSPNMNVGLFFHNTRFYAGLSAFNMIGKNTLEREDISLSLHDLHFFLTAGAMVPITDAIEFKPSFLIKQVKGSPTNVDLNGMFLFYDRLWLGASYRTNMHIWNDNLESNISRRNAMAFIVEVFASDKVRFGYAYDQSLNALQNSRNNSHEFSVGFYLSPRKVTMKNPRWF